MRFNDKEISRLSENKGEIQGILHHLRPQENEWSDWYQQPYFKERLFKLVINLLFYFRIGDQEPAGVFVLENVQVAYERPLKGTSFAFSLTFKTADKVKNGDQKHIFSCRCEEDVNKWVRALKSASYEHWRSQLIILKTKISMRTGQEPILDNTNKLQIQTDNKKKIETISVKNGSFLSHIKTKNSNTNEEQENINTSHRASKDFVLNKNITVGKLVDL